MLGISVLAVKEPEPNLRGSIRVTTRNDAVILPAALSASGMCAEAASHRAFHAVFV